MTGVSAYTHDNASGSGDDSASVTITFSVPSTDNGATVMLLFGGHIAASPGPRGWGLGVGAAAISGGPYHISLAALDNGDGNVGNRDNQIMAGALVAPANIVIHKVAVGGDATFGYTGTGGISSPFSISTSGGAGSQSFTNVSAGGYTVTESGSSGWVGTSRVSPAPTGQRHERQRSDREHRPRFRRDRSLHLHEHEARPEHRREEVTNPEGDSAAFTFTPSYGASFQLSDGQHNDSALLAPGTYSVSEVRPGRVGPDELDLR